MMTSDLDGKLIMIDAKTGERTDYGVVWSIRTIADYVCVLAVDQSQDCYWIFITTKEGPICQMGWRMEREADCADYWTSLCRENIEEEIRLCREKKVN